MSGGFFFVAILLAFFLLNDRPKSRKKDDSEDKAGFVPAIKEISSLVSLLFFMAIINLGVAQGVFQNYSPIYLEEYMDATSTMFGYSTSFATAVGVLVSPFLSWTIRKSGEMNIIFFSMVAQVLRLIGFALIV